MLPLHPSSLPFSCLPSEFATLPWPCPHVAYLGALSGEGVHSKVHACSYTPRPAHTCAHWAYLDTQVYAHGTCFQTGTRRCPGAHIGTQGATVVSQPHMHTHVSTHACLQAPRPLAPGPPGLYSGSWASHEALRKGQQRGKGGIVKDTSKERGKKNEVEEIKSKGF